MQIYLKFALNYTHNSTAAMKNTPTILIVSITKLKIALLIIVQNLVVNNVYLFNCPGA